MAGTISGGRKAAATNKKRHGKNFYATIGAMGGKKSTGGGFASGKTCYCNIIIEPHSHARCAGVKGGLTSSRKGVSNRERN